MKRKITDLYRESSKALMPSFLGILSIDAFNRTLIMSVSLKRVLRKNEATIDQLLDALNLTIQIQDATGTVLKGIPGLESTHYHPIMLGEILIGRVMGTPSAAILASLLSHLSQREQETRMLAHEVLEHYREINLLYNLSEKLSASLDLTIVAQTVLTEARRLIPTTTACIMLLNSVSRQFEPDLIFHQGSNGCAPEDLLQIQQGIAESVAQTGKGEMVNDWKTDRRCQFQSHLIYSMVCVPLKIDQGVIGVITISQQDLMDYTAQHLKLLTTVASQASQAIANAQLHQQQLQKAKAREEQLKQQLRELQLEIDEAKRAKQVAEITETEYFQQLQQRAGQLRRRRQG